MELLDLYNRDKEKTGEIVERGGKSPKDRYYLVVVIWIENKKGELLIQKRAKTKNSNPDKWAEG